MIRFVYKTTNPLNGKIYIGQHTTENIDDGYLGSGVILQKAFKKYGKENFTREIIALADTQEDLNHAEEFFIKHYRDKIGWGMMYNATECAFGGGCHTEESKKKMSAALKGREGWNKGRHLTEETKLKISEARKGQPSPRKGRHLTEETKLNISEAHKGRPNESWRGRHHTEESKLKMSTTKKGHKGRHHTEESKLKMSAAQKGHPGWNKGRRFSEEHKQKISEALKDHTVSEESKLKISKANKNRPSTSKPILCVETNIVYPSIGEASRQTGIAQQTISNVCREKQKTTGGYHWKYIEE